MVGEGWFRKRWMWGWVSIPRWIKDPGSKLCWGCPQLLWVRPVLKTCACMSVHGYFWRYWGLGVLSCSMTNSGILPLGIRMCHSWLSWGAILTPVQRMKWCVFACHKPDTQWLIFIHSVSKEKLCEYLPDLLTWIFLTNDSFDAEESNLVFRHRQIHRYETSPRDTVLESTQGKKKRTAAHCWLRCAIFWAYGLHGNVKDHSPGLEEYLSAVCRWNVTDTYLKSKQWRWTFSLIWVALQWNPYSLCFLGLNVNQRSQTLPGVFKLQSQQQTAYTWFAATTQNTPIPFSSFCKVVWVTWQRKKISQVGHTGTVCSVWSAWKVNKGHLYVPSSRICPKSEGEQNSLSILLHGTLIPRIYESTELLLSAELWEAV